MPEFENEFIIFPSPNFYNRINILLFYSSGHVIKGQEANTTKSRYAEDVYPGNHSSVWGSYWDAGRWGYKCCHSFIKQSYCTGK